MKARVALLAAATLCLECTTSGAAPQDDPSAHGRVIATVDARQTAEPVSKYEFGMFIEHIRTTHLSQPMGRDARRPKILLPNLLQGA